MSRSASDPGRTAIAGAAVFGGQHLTGPWTVVIDGAVIASVSYAPPPGDAMVIDAAGAVLLPGLIDAHVHLDDEGTLHALASWGVTTALDMASWPPEKVARLRAADGATDIRSPGLPAIGPAGPHATIMKLPAAAIVTSPEQARSLVAQRVAEGADYIKIVLEAPGRGGPEPDVAEALTVAAHEHGKFVVAHASSRAAYSLAVRAGADMITHVPFDQPPADDDIARMRSGDRVAIPTLAMAEVMSAGRNIPYQPAADSVAALHRAGIPILAGTDANTMPGPFGVRHGESLHHELELLVAAGLTPVEALRAATELPARHFGLPDRGAVAAGLRADLVLIDGDPVTDIRATRNIRHVWCAGTAHPGPS